MKPIGGHVGYVAAVILIRLLIGYSFAAMAADLKPLSVFDASSPRATLQGFVETTDDIYVRWRDVLNNYRDSGRLFPTPEERRTEISILGSIPKALRALDLSRISPVLRDTVAVERLLQLREVLDRIQLPAMEDVPDRAAMANVTPKRWRIPDTEIDFVRIEDGQNAGEYVVSADTVDRLPEFYQRVKDLPYKPGPATGVEAAFHALNPHGTNTIYDYFASSPLGLSYVIPMRWMLSWPDWVRFRIGGATLWQWVGLVLGLLVGALLIFLSHRLASRLADRNQDQPGPSWHALPVPIGIAFVAGILTPWVCAVIRIAGAPRVIIAFVQTTALYLTVAWLAIIGSIIFGEVIVGAEHLKLRSLDSQLIRLGTRLAGVVAATAYLIRGADELGFPAYSVLAGLGVGGLAVALAARDSLANLLGSMLIMFEKPFRVGHYIRLSGTEGAVEDVGFRSTRIRTLDNSLISIPNNSVVNTTVENLSLRPKRRQRFFVGVTYDTPRRRMEELIAGIKQVIMDHPLTDKSNFQVCFNSFAESSLDILVLFHLTVEDSAAEMLGREQILLQIMQTAEGLGVSFAFPTRTLIVETATSDAESLEMSRRPWLAS
jgi:MscS family membrane protein